MITVADVVGAASLNLRVVAGAQSLGRPVTSAHVSELTSPGDWLRGGELLMTVGLLLPMRPQDCRAYVSECTAAGVAALALGTGHGLPYQDCPPPLRAAAEDCGMPLLIVPDATPFIAVTKWVFETLAAEEHADLQRAMQINRTLTAVATSAAPLPALLSAWAQSSEAACVVCDSAGRLLATTPSTPGEVVDRILALVPRMMVAPRRNALSVVDEFEVHTVGAQVPLGYIVLSADMDATSRSASSVLVSLIAVDIERRHLSAQPERDRRDMVFGQLLKPGVKSDRAQQLAAAIGLTAGLYHVAVVTGADADAVAFRLRTALDGVLMRVQANTVELAHPDLEALTATLRTHARGLPAGIGAAAAPGSLAVSAMQARSLVRVSARLGRPVTASEGETVSLLLSLGNAEVIRGFSDAVLAPLDMVEPHERVELLRTLEQWLRANGAWESAAAQLSLHRNTVRNRIQRVAKLTGRRLDDGDERMELWLALKARAAFP